MTFPVRKWRFAVTGVESPGKIKLVAKTQRVADLFQTLIGIDQLIFGETEKKIVDIVADTDADLLAKLFGQFTFRDKSALGKLGNIELDGKIVLDIAHGVGDEGRNSGNAVVTQVKFLQKAADLRRQLLL